MNKRLVEKKNQILRVIGREEYYSILRFLEAIYLSNYDLKIFKARKMSNLYLALKELLLEEGGGRVNRKYTEAFPEPEREPIIIADWAFDYLDLAYPNKKVKSVLLIDDIIIHGRTLAKLYYHVEKKYPDSDIKIKTYAKNIEDYLKLPAINDAEAVFEGNIEICRKYSQMFVDVFMAMNQPYTSYVPNIAIKMNGRDGNNAVDDMRLLWQWLENHKADSGLYEEVERKIPFYETRVWVGKSDVSNALLPSLRVYHNKENEDYAIVPMVSLKPMDSETLRKQLDILVGKGIFTQKYAQRWQGNTTLGTLDYRALVYAVSTLWGRYFFKKRGIFDAVINKIEVLEEENMNFGGTLLNRSELELLNLDDMIELFKELELEENYEPVNNDILRSPESPLTSIINTLSDKLGEIINEHTADDPKLKWKEIVRSFLREDSLLDEKEWRERPQMDEPYSSVFSPQRIPGLPIVLFMEKVDKDETVIAFKEILKAIDHGEGSIVPETFELKGKRYFVSSIHAGEQNYKYVEQKYYSELYGMYLIERDRYNDTDILDEMSDNSECEYDSKEGTNTKLKRKLLTKLQLQDNEFLKEMAASSVCKKLAAPLRSDFFMYVGDEYLDQVVGIVYKLLGRSVSNEY